LSLILGINSAYHESAAAIVRDGEVLFAIEEERLSRRKHAKIARVTNPDELPWHAIRACLAAADRASLRDVDAIAYSLAPGRRLELIGGDPYELDDDTGYGTRCGEEEFNRRVLDVPRILAQSADDESLVRRFHYIPHHRAHAACAFYTSPFQHAAILVVDGIGETSTAWLGRGSPDSFEVIEEIAYPHSIGMLWERVAVYLGFTEFDACKVMGLAAWGNPHRFGTEFDRLFRVIEPDGGSRKWGGPPFLIDPHLAQLRRSDVRGLESLFGPRRTPTEPIEQKRFADIAAGLQERTNEAVLALARRLARDTGERNLAYAGGVALNCVANAHLERERPFRSLFIFGAAHDAGTAIGAALKVAYEHGAARPRLVRSDQCGVSPFLGPCYDARAIEPTIVRRGFTAERVADAPAGAAKLIAAGRIVGWFQGRMEFGPRALGGRSLLADPRRPAIPGALNQLIKHREPFRPFGASILAEHLAEWFLVGQAFELDTLVGQAVSPNVSLERLTYFDVPVAGQAFQPDMEPQRRTRAHASTTGAIPADRPGAASCRHFMIVAYKVRPDRAGLIPAVVHADGTCRVQTVDRKHAPQFHALLTHFHELTGIPLVLNTSFNDREPIVATPDDALETFARAPIEALFLGDYLVQRRHG
jgi:carbamoyltransferase